MNIVNSFGVLSGLQLNKKKNKSLADWCFEQK